MITHWLNWKGQEETKVDASKIKSDNQTWKYWLEL